MLQPEILPRSSPDAYSVFRNGSPVDWAPVSLDPFLMTFEKRGYLSLEMTQWTERIRAEDAAHFALVDDMSD